MRVRLIWPRASDVALVAVFAPFGFLGETLQDWSFAGLVFVLQAFIELL